MKEIPPSAGAIPSDWKRRALANVVVGVGWFPPDQFPAAVAHWPRLNESWKAATYEEYCRLLQGNLLNFAAKGLTLRLAPIRVEPFIAWCKTAGADPSTPQARSGYAAELARHGESIPWPPGRKDPCWCGSARKYKKCCGTAPPAPLEERNAL